MFGIKKGSPKNTTKKPERNNSFTSVFIRVRNPNRIKKLNGKVGTTITAILDMITDKQLEEIISYSKSNTKSNKLNLLEKLSRLENKIEKDILNVKRK